MPKKISKSPSDANFLICAPTYKILQQSTLPSIFNIWPASSYKYNKVDSTIQLKDGRIIYLRTGTDPNAAEGIQRVHAVWGDEAGMFSKLFWYNIEARTSFKQAQILLTSTPYAMNWVKKDIIDQYEKNKRPDILYRRWRSIDNPSFPKEEFERQKQILPANIFRRKYEGIHEKMEGLVFENLSGDNFCQPFNLPEGTRYFAGVDWGFKHAFAISIRAVTVQGYHFTVSEFKQSGLDPQEKVAVARSKAKIFNVEHFYCGVDRPEMIDMFNDAGVRSSGFFMDSDKRYREVIPQIEAHAELIKTRRYKIFSNTCPFLEDEYETYHWPEPKEDDRIREVPVDINDDLISAERYVTVGTLHLTKKSAIHLPDKLLPSPSRDVWNPSKRSQDKPWNAY
jgi:PBSX family phage terminase large subunit